MRDDAVKYINWVNGIGTLCMTSRPCKHRLVVEDVGGQEVTIKYAAADQIKAIFDKTGQQQRPHILETLEQIAQEDAEDEREAQAEANGLPKVFCLYQEKYNAAEKLIMMNTDREQFIKDLSKYLLHGIRDGDDCCEDWMDFESFYDSYESTIQENAREATGEAEEYSESGWIFDMLNLSPAEDVHILIKHMEMDPKLESSAVCCNIVPCRGIAEKEGDPPRQWYLQYLAKNLFNIDTNGKDYAQLLPEVSKAYVEEFGYEPAWVERQEPVGQDF